MIGNSQVYVQRMSAQASKLVFTSISEASTGLYVCTAGPVTSYYSINVKRKFFVVVVITLFCCFIYLFIHLLKSHRKVRDGSLIQLNSATTLASQPAASYSLNFLITIGLRPV